MSVTEPKHRRDAAYLKTPGPQKGAGPYMAKYHCLKCDIPFVFNPSLGKTPHCPVCRGTRCEAKSPAVLVTRVLRAHTRSSIKKALFKQKIDRTLRRMQEQKTGFLSLMRVLGVSEQAFAAAGVALDNGLQAAEVAAQGTLARYREDHGNSEK